MSEFGITSVPRAIWDHVCAEGRLFVTLDLDFSDVRRYKPGTHPGILLIRARSRSATAVSEVLARIKLPRFCVGLSGRNSGGSADTIGAGQARVAGSISCDRRKTFPVRSIARSVCARRPAPKALVGRSRLM
jgi:hypothetical protein